MTNTIEDGLTDEELQWLAEAPAVNCVTVHIPLPEPIPQTVWGLIAKGCLMIYAAGDRKRAVMGVTAHGGRLYEAELSIREEDARQAAAERAD